MSPNKPARLLFPLFGLCLLALSLGQFSVIFRFNEGGVYLFDLLIFIFNVVGFVILLATKQAIKIPMPIFFLVIFCILGAASLLFTPLSLEPTEFLISLSYLLRFLSYVIFALITRSLIKSGTIRIDEVYRAIIYSGFFLFILGLFQLAVLSDLETLDASLGWDPHKNRMVSTFFDPNFLGIYFVICLAVALKRKMMLNRYSLISYLPTTVFLSGIVLTFSRSAWLASAVFLFFTLLRKKRLLLVSLAIVLLAIFAIPRIQTRISGVTDSQDSASFRLVSWGNTWEVAKENWVFGVGYNAFRYAQREAGFIDDSTRAARSGAGSDSSLLLVLATTGIFGFMSFVSFFVSTLLPSVRRGDLVIAGLILALLVDSLFINSLFYPQVTVTLLLLITTSQGRAKLSA
jgi:O-antigen ligase